MCIIDKPYICHWRGKTQRASMEKQATVKQVKQVKQRILEITIDNFLWHSSHFLAQTTPIHHHLKIKDVDVKPSIPIPKHLQRWKLLRRRKSIVKNIDIDAPYCQTKLINIQLFCHSDHFRIQNNAPLNSVSQIMHIWPLICHDMSNRYRFMAKIKFRWRPSLISRWRP